MRTDAVTDIKSKAEQDHDWKPIHRWIKVRRRGRQFQTHEVMEESVKEEEEAAMCG